MGKIEQDAVYHLKDLILTFVQCPEGILAVCFLKDRHMLLEKTRVLSELLFIAYFDVHKLMEHSNVTFYSRNLPQYRVLLSLKFQYDMFICPYLIVSTVT